MLEFLEELSARRRFGMKPGLDTIRALCAALGDPQKRVRAIHVAGTNGKGAVCAMLAACLPGRVGRYTSPHLVRLNERFFLDGAPVADETLERVSASVARKIAELEGRSGADVTFFEALTAVAFELYAQARCDRVVLETGLGGRLDATNVCVPELCVITRIGLDHCDWLGTTVEAIAAEKAGIIKPGVPVVLGCNAPSVRTVVAARAKAVGAPFFYAPEQAHEREIPRDFSLPGAFNRENAVTALAALKVLGDGKVSRQMREGFSRVVWPGRFQRVGPFIVDGAHNPPAARALAAALDELPETKRGEKLVLVAGFCGDKDVAETLRILAPYVGRGLAVRTNNPRSLSAAATAEKMRAAGIAAAPAASLSAAIAQCRESPAALICGSLFLAGEALVELNAYPWPTDRFDPSEALKSCRPPSYLL